MGTAIVNAKIPGTNKVYDLVVSTYQMCILFMFNYTNELTLEEIADQMGFDPETTKKNMQSLMTAKTKILTVKDGKFSINFSFQSPARRVVFPVPLLEEAVKKERITADRSHAVDAVIVRIMKTRKKMKI